MGFERKFCSLGCEFWLEMGKKLKKNGEKVAGKKKVRIFARP